MAKRRFRKVYIITDSNTSVFGKSSYMVTNIFRDKKNAEATCEVRNRNALEEANKFYSAKGPVSQYRVHTFFLIHEAYFKEENDG